MENRWTLHVENLGKIESADLTIAPFTMFVGDNNSGKSYLMSILYTLLNIRFSRSGYNMCTDTMEYKCCAEWIKQQKKDDGVSIEVNEHSIKKFEALLNIILERNLDRISKQTFNAQVGIGKISIQFPAKMTLGFFFDEESMGDDSSRIIKAILFKRGIRRFSLRTIFKECGDEEATAFKIGFILEYLLKAEFGLTPSLNEIVFLPTSRTGFLLTYKTLVQASLSNVYDWEDKQTESNLTRPCSDFLKNLVSINPDKTILEYCDIIEFIEEKMVGGHISLSQDAPQPVIRYRPKMAEKDFPLHLTSGVVTEVTPLLLMLKYHNPMKVLFIEEPEMELHPALQAEMAKVLNRIRAKKTPLFVATHSDIILQQLNNMIKLDSLPQEKQRLFMEKYGYEPKDVLSPEDVAIYQLDVDNESGKTTVHALEHNEYGFIVPTFNNAFKKIMQETRSLEEYDTEE